MAPSLRQRLLTGGLWVLLGKVVTALANLVVTVLLARLLTQRLVGVYGLAFSLVTLGAMAAQLGLHLAVVRLVAEAMGRGEPGRARAAAARVVRYCLLGNALVVAVLLLGGARWIAAWWDAPLLTSVLGGIAVWTVLTSFQVLISETFRGFQDLRLATLFGGVITGIVMLAALLVMWLGGVEFGLRHAIAVACASTAISVLVGAAVLGARLRRLERGPAPARREMFAIALPLWVNGLTAFALTQVDLWILGSFVPKEQVGVYFVAMRLVALVSMSLLLVNLVVPPFIAELYSQGQIRRLERVLRQTATVAGLPALGVLLAYLFFGVRILELVGPEYGVGATVLALLSLGKLVNVLTGSCGITMGMTGHQNVLMVITVLSSTLTVVAALWAVRQHGMIGVAAAACGGMIVQNVAMWLATRRVTGMWTHVGMIRPAEIRALLASLR